MVAAPGPVPMCPMPKSWPASYIAFFFSRYERLNQLIASRTRTHDVAQCSCRSVPNVIISNGGLATIYIMRVMTVKIIMSNDDEATPANKRRAKTAGHE